MRIAVIGAGSWGTTIASVTSGRTKTTLWSRRPEIAESIRTNRRNPAYLSSYSLPDELEATSDLAEAISGVDLIVMAVPSHGYRDTISKASGLIEGEVAILSLTKGIEQHTLLRMTQVTAEAVPSHPSSLIGVLTGPNLAPEVMAGQPTASVVAFEEVEVARRCQDVLMSSSFRIYTNTDVVGCETAGAVKNVLAIAAGMAKGLGFGDNTLAALVTRALAELTRLGVALGGEPVTFAGLAGMGDLIATCMSATSRNYRVGYGLGQGRTLQEVTDEMQMVAEGIKTTRAVLDLAARAGVEVPISEQVGRVLYEEAAPSEAVLALMSRAPKDERD